MKWKNRKFQKRVEEHHQQCIEISRQHNLALAEINAFNVLENRPLVRTLPDLPPAPVDRIFVPHSKLKEMVLEAYTFHGRYNAILQRKETTKILDKLERL